MRARPLLRLLSALALVVPCVTAAVPDDSAACINSTHRELDPLISNLVEAERVLLAGRFAEAADMALNAYPQLRAASGPEYTSNALLGRAQRIVAVAVVRTQGLLSGGEAFHASTAAERRAALEWAVANLRRLSAAASDAPALETDLGEALETLPETQGEGRAVLEKLAGKDLVTSRQGWAALARLRRAAGDMAGYEAARQRAESPAGPASPAEAAPSKAPDAPVPGPRGVPRSARGNT